MVSRRLANFLKYFRKFVFREAGQRSQIFGVLGIAKACTTMLWSTTISEIAIGHGSLWKIGSGYRQGTSSSQHNKGQACDVNLIGSGDDRKQKTFELVQQLEKIVPYDQIILEYRAPSSNWIHTSYSATNRRKMAFTMLNDSTYKRDSAGNPAGFYLL